MRGELRNLQNELGISFVHVTHSQDEALALADDIIVMNEAIIEQAGSAREVFNSPKTRFVAKFMGGHNVINLPDGEFAIRADGVKILTPEAGMIQANVSAIEYQGTHVSVLTKIAGDQEVTAIISDAEFFSDPYSPGDSVSLNWDKKNIHQLSA